MAPFPSLRRSPRGLKENERRGVWDDVKIPNGPPSHQQEGIQPDNSSGAADGTIKRRRGSFIKKDLLHSLRNRLTGKPAPQRGPSSQEEEVPELSTTTSTTSAPPPIPVNPNKPLPSPPPPGSEQTRKPPDKLPLKARRIMSILAESDIEKLFSGAPQYFARSEGHYTGAPHPSVAFPWDEKLEIRDLADHSQIEDKAWSSVTAWPHITRDVSSDRSTAQRASEAKQQAHFYPRCRERPNMLSMFGLEKGSVGYQAALELAVSDALQDQQWGFEQLGTRLPAIVDQRQRMLTSKNGLRQVDESLIMERLIKNGERYGGKFPFAERMSSELYNELFLHLLHPPARVLDPRDPYSLSVQILALVKVLAAPNMWIDFSHPEWRIRIGQLLWETPGEDDKEDGSSTKPADSSSDLHEERYWLFLQILLACELLVRLDAITEGDELGVETIRPAEIHRFEKEASQPVKWSLILARVWLENIEIVKTAANTPVNAGEKPSGWLATLTKHMSLARDHGSETGHHHHQPHQLCHCAPAYAIKGKHVRRQVRGLAHFARRLKWPEANSCVSEIAENCRSIADGTPLNTPFASPSSRAGSQRSSYFGEQNRGSQGQYTPSRRRKISAALYPSGWLSKSYVSGLMLPGEGICHFLMATLLENDSAALSKLGPMANLCGGFIYSGKSFWSTSCIVGRVLCAGKGAVECMGWISSDVVPQGLGDRWVNIEGEETRDDALQIDKKARLWGKKAIEKESNVLGSTDSTSTLPADFIIPYEGVYPEATPPTLDIELRALSLSALTEAIGTASAEGYEATPTSDVSNDSQASEIRTYSAAVSFTVTDIDLEESTEYTFTLMKDINFVTAHPCVPSQHVKVVKSPSSPTIQQVNLPGDAFSGKTVSVVGHPLHKFFTYMTLHLSELLAKREFTLETLLSSYVPTGHSVAPSQRDSAAKVLVIDCITGFQPQPQEHEIPLSPVVSRTDSTTSDLSVSPSSSNVTINANGDGGGGASSGSFFEGALESASKKMHSETRRRQFGSDMEILVRAFCAEKGWNALISRRRRGCLACAIREAGALGWKVVIRVD